MRLATVIALVLAPALLAGDGPKITGKVLYGRVEDARRAAVVDILAVYAQNPVYVYMKAKGYSETDAHGAPLFALAQKATNSALAGEARARGVDVVTVPGGVEGGETPPPDLTAAVVERLPLHYAPDGAVVYGQVRTARRVAQLDVDALNRAIPAWRELQDLSPSDASYHLMRQRYTDAFQQAVRIAARSGGYDALAARGEVASRAGPVPDVTAAAIGAVD